MNWSSARSSKKQTTAELVVAAAILNAALLAGCAGGRQKEAIANERVAFETAPQTSGKAPPIPEAGPLAKPRSLQQTGLPAELTKSVMPADNPQTPEKIALGQRLFFDGRLSADGTVACATCHDPRRAFTDGVPTSIGIGGRVGQRNAPTILNALYNKT